MKWKMEKATFGFCIYKLWQILKHFAGNFCWAQTLKLGWVILHMSQNIYKLQYNFFRIIKINIYLHAYLVSSGKTWQNGFGLNFCSSGWSRLKFMTSMPKYQNFPCKNMSMNQKLPINMTKFKNSVKANFQKYHVLRWNMDL